jgi:hypothetical protein
MKKPVAKAKRRQEAVTADEEALAEYEARIPVVRSHAVEKKSRNEIPTRQVVNIMADEIQVVYEIMGSRLDDVNAHDKALTLWRDISAKGVRAKDQEVPHTLCEEHS